MTDAASVAPKIRFPEFTGDWEHKRGGDAFKSRRARGEEGLPLYSVTIERGMVRRDSLDREFASNATDESNLRAEKDDLVYNMMRMWQGAVGRAPEKCMVSPAYVVLAPKSETSPQFFEYWLKRARSIYLMWAYSYGLTKDRLRLYYPDFTRVPMTLPGPDEQRKIGEFFSTLDAGIEGLQAQLLTLQSYKRGIVQRIFSRNSRFIRDDNVGFPDWKNEHLGDLATVKKGEQLNRDTLDETVGYPVMNGGVSPSGFTDKFNTIGGSIIISEGGNSCGHVGFQKGNFWLGGHCYLITPDLTKVCHFFLLHALRFRQPIIQRLRVGSGLPNIQKGDLLKVSLPIPHLDEQRKIADFLNAIDDKITAVSEQIDQMQTFKKGLLQQMFV